MSPISKLMDDWLGCVAQPIDPILRSPIKRDHAAPNDTLTVLVTGKLPPHRALRCAALGVSFRCLCRSLFTSRLLGGDFD